MKIGEKIRQLRIKEKLTQKELAQKLGVAHNTVSDYERCVKAVSLVQLEKLCEVFEVEKSYFLDTNEAVITEEDKKLLNSNRMIVEDLLDTLISRGTISDPNNIDKSTIDMLVQVMKKDIEDKLKKVK